MKKIDISVLGDGGWGTTLAILLCQKGHNVTLWGAFQDYSKFMREKRSNPRFLPGAKIPAAIKITSNIKEAVSNKKVVVLAVPAQYIRGVLKRVKNSGEGVKESIFLSVAKGIEISSLKRVSEIIREELGRVRVAVLSGPTIAGEVIQGIPTAAVIASENRSLREYLQDIFTTASFRIYTNSDVTGVELGGSLKNVIAIACGVSDGLKFGTNTKAAILSRGLAEISRLGKAMGARARTFSGMSGLGDLVTTCISKQSRNRFVGEEFGRGKKLNQIIKNMRMVAEGVPTAKSAYGLGLKYKVEMPITREVYNLLYRNKSPKQAVKDLMTRKKKEE